MCFLLMIGSAGCSNDDDSNDIGHKESCISGEISQFKSDNPGLEDYVAIGRLNMPEGDDKYSYIKFVVVHKDDMPIHKYCDGDIIEFKIEEVKSTFPPAQTGLFTPTSFLCSIELCK